MKKLEEFFENEKKQVEIIELPIEDTDAFFSMKREKGRIIISLNTNNKWVELVCDALDSSSDEEDGEMPMSYEEQKIKLDVLQTTIKLLFYAWGKLELETSADDEKKASRRVRSTLGYNMDKLAAEALDYFS